MQAYFAVDAVAPPFGMSATGFRAFGACCGLSVTGLRESGINLRGWTWTGCVCGGSGTLLAPPVGRSFTGGPGTTSSCAGLRGPLVVFWRGSSSVELVALEGPDNALSDSVR